MKNNPNNKPTFLYFYWWRGRVVTLGSTDDLKHQESEHQKKWPGGYIEPAGRISTETVAQKQVRKVE